jgi:uncharacterized protein YprB with RNaseH-like and TPR domain
MLEQTFCHIHGVGHTTEHTLWTHGVRCWQDLLARPGLVGRVSTQEVVSTLEESFRAVDDNPMFFSSRLKQADSWRLFPHYRRKAGYLDIETTGLGQGCEITTIALYDGERVRTYINGDNLEAFADDVQAIELFITFNGMSFDIPVIENYFRIKLGQPHIDLRYVLADLGIKGGLKRCEKSLGLNRGTLDGIDGSFAVLLWREYERTGNQRALETLLAYNIEDTVNLERLMIEAYNRNLEKTPFYDDLLLPAPEPPQIIHHPDLDIVDTIKRQKRSAYTSF